jgi:single-strand DNA-binding protein
MNVHEILGLSSEPVTKQAGQSTVTEVNAYDKVGYGEKAHTNWYTIKAWGKLGEFLQKNFKKGDRIYVTGELDFREYTTQAGEKRIINEITASQLKFGSSKTQQVAQTTEVAETAKDDLPF